MVILLFTMIILGHINYLNCIPVHGAILQNRVPFAGRIVTGNPAELNRMLKEGGVDVSPSSSVELAQGHRILPGLSISGRNDVKSILLLLRKPIEETGRGTFFLTSHSATSVLLLKLLFREFYRIDGVFEVFDPDTTGLDRIPENAAGVLFIGDYALRLGKRLVGRPDTRFPYSYDLAELWSGHTGLPFTFALWQVRSGCTDRNGVRKTVQSLRESYGYFLENSSSLAESFASQFQMSPEDILEYWSHLSFAFEEKNLESLRLFFRLCARHGLMHEVPEIHFFE